MNFKISFEKDNKQYCNIPKYGLPPNEKNYAPHTNMYRTSCYLPGPSISTFGTLLSQFICVPVTCSSAARNGSANHRLAI